MINFRNAAIKTKIPVHKETYDLYYHNKYEQNKMYHLQNDISYSV